MRRISKYERNLIKRTAELKELMPRALRFHRALLMQQLKNIQVALAERNISEKAPDWLMEFLEKETKP